MSENYFVGFLPTLADLRRFASAADTFVATPVEDTFAAAGDTFAAAGDTFAAAEDTFAAADDTFAAAGDRFAAAEDTLAAVTFDTLLVTFAVNDFALAGENIPTFHSLFR